MQNLIPTIQTESTVAYENPGKAIALISLSLCFCHRHCFNCEVHPVDFVRSFADE